MSDQLAGRRRVAGVYAALSAGTAFLIVGHRSVYASQKIGISKSAGLDLTLEVPVGDIDRASMRIRPGSLTERALRAGGTLRSHARWPRRKPPGSEPPPG